MVGVFVPLPITEYLTLYSIQKDTTKSNIIRDILTKEYKILLKTLPVDFLIKSIIEQQQENWDEIAKRVNLKEKRFKEFTEKLRETLIYKSTPIFIVDQIISKIKM